MKKNKLAFRAARIALVMLLLWASWWAYGMWGPPNIRTVRGCERLEKRSMGMTSEEVKAVLGEPHYEDEVPGLTWTVWHYSPSEAPPLGIEFLGRWRSLETGRFAICFEDEKARSCAWAPPGEGVSYHVFADRL